FSSSVAAHRHLHSFPTRRSSDLPEFYPERAGETAAGPFNKADPVFLTWRTDEKEGRTLLPAEARPRVIEAWKRIKARDRAKAEADRKSTRLNSSHVAISYAVFCL